MGWESFNGVMAHVIVENICLVKNMEMGNLFSIMENIMMGILWMESKMDLGHYIVNKGKCSRKGIGKMGSSLQNDFYLEFRCL